MYDRHEGKGWSRNLWRVRSDRVQEEKNIVHDVAASLEPFEQVAHVAARSLAVREPPSIVRGLEFRFAASTKLSHDARVSSGALRQSRK
jgi:hypothetical protein